MGIATAWPSSGAALWLAAATLALCLVAAGWRRTCRRPGSDGGHYSPSVSACCYSRCWCWSDRLASRAGAVLKPGPRATGAGVDRYPGAGRLCLFLAQGLQAPPGGTARPVAGGTGAGVHGQGDPGDVRAWRAGLTARSLLADLLRWPPRSLICSRLHQPSASTCARSGPSVSCGGRSCRCSGGVAGDWLSAAYLNRHGCTG